MFRIVEYLCAGVDAKHVDFDSFTLEELNNVYNGAHGLYTYEDMPHMESEKENWYIPIYEYVRCTRNIYERIHSLKSQLSFCSFRVQLHCIGMG